MDGIDPELKRALDDLDAAELEMVEGEGWSERDAEDWFYTCACQLAYLWRDIKKPPVEPQLGRFMIGVTFGISPLDGKPFMKPMHSDERD